MEIQKYIYKIKKIYTDLLLYIESDDSCDDSFNQLISNIKDKKIHENNKEFENFLNLIINISNNHYRDSLFFDKIKRIIDVFEENITNFLTNKEIFQLFESNKILLLFLIEKGILEYDECINKFIENKMEAEYTKICHFFLPEMIKFRKSDKYETEYKTIDKFEEKRQNGENDLYICSLIRNDSIDDFIVFINQTNFPLNSQIKRSIFETNSFLIEREPTLIEYAAFFGSIRIFQYLIMNKIEVTPSLLLYSIHSKNEEMISSVLEKLVSPTEDLFNLCFLEAIKCHHNEIAHYIKNNLLNDKVSKQKFKEISETIFHYSNYEFFFEKFNKIDFFFLCKFNYSKIVDMILDNDKDYILSKKQQISKAANENDIEAVYFLLQNKIKITDSFFRNNKLKELVIPTSIKSIEKLSFEGCYLLKKIVIPNSVTKIGNCAFKGCSSLKKIVIPSSVTKIEEFTFDSCSSLTKISIPYSVTYIGEYAFCNCYSLSEIKFPCSVTEIGVWAFSGCNFDLIVIPSTIKLQSMKNVKYEKIIRF